MVGQRWYVARVTPKNEFKASKEFQSQGLEVYLPTYRSDDSGSGDSVLPLFPGYLFVCLPKDLDDIPTFRSSHRILGFLKFDHEMAWLSEEEIFELVEYCEGHEGEVVWNRFRAGQRVLVRTNGWEVAAEVVGEPKSPGNRVRVLVEFMGRMVPTLVPWANLSTVQQDLAPFMGSDRKLPRRTRGRKRWIKPLVIESL